ncbi:beta strand repeat-containing protein [Gloeothece verrucosa]|uniref:Polymorphic outer membrane protein n=1 Tax=Gloeothece verrucosa (strain PCC 7822) TaxID=497965 RepID=E0U9C8_GLOV7|nr:cadherin domain-containing protein [Gloeothece verrucosa]ADN12620.1 polymorphic outer membrane protein [Gloeothece verrucosa PCC 7822]
MGGAIYNNSSSPTLTNTSFILNKASDEGGAIYNNGSNAQITNSVFSRNDATSYGGGIYNYNSDPTLVNTTFSSNTANSGSGLYNTGYYSSGYYYQSNVTATNSIFWGNEDSNNTGAQIVNVTSYGTATVTYSIVQNGYTGTGNINADPKFVNPASDDLRLSAGSPAIDSALPGALPADSRDLDKDGDKTELTPVDLANNPRLVGSGLDIGAYEGVAVSPTPPTLEKKILFVNSNASGSNNGSSWTNAFSDLQAALNAAQAGDEIWVTAGTYKPTSGSNRSATFALKDHVAIYGGFSGIESDLSQRDFQKNVTILSGEIGNIVNTTADNSYHVVTGTGVTNTAILDGFTITAGNANGSGDNANGAGLWSSSGSPTLKNLIFDNNNAVGNGGGLYNGGGSSPIVFNVTFSNNKAANGGGAFNESSTSSFTKVTFSNNSATNYGAGIYNNSSAIILNEGTFSQNTSTNYGGAIYNTSSNAIITNTSFSENKSNYGGAIFNLSSSPTLINTSFILNKAGDEGGAIYNNGSNAQITNSVFSRNDAKGNGGGIYNYNSDPTVVNTTFSLNTASSGSGLYNTGYYSGGYYYQSNVTATNSIFWGNEDSNKTGTQIVNVASYGTATVTYSIVQNGYTGTGNKNADPKFVNPGADDLRLSSGSPAIDGGYPGALPADSQDLDKDGDKTESIPIDLKGVPRLIGASVDIGAYENTQNTNQPPVLNDATFTISKNSPLNTVVGTVTASDPDSTNLTYSITAGNPDLDKDNKFAFAIDNSGKITVTDPDDFGTNTKIDLTLNVSDGQLSDTAKATINITPANVAPVANDVTFTLAEKTAVNTLVGTVIASDSDGDALTYSITGGNLDVDGDGTAAFAIDNTGKITVTDADDLDYETHPKFNLTVTASDGKLQDDAAITIQLSNIDEDRPVVSKIKDTSVEKGIVAGGIIVAGDKVSATDPDTPVENLTFSLKSVPKDKSGNPFFAIDSKTGEITITQTGVNNLKFTDTTYSYKLGVVASDGVNTSSEETFNVLTNTNPISSQIKLLEDNNGSVGNEITNVILKDSFFVEINLADLRTNAAGIITSALNLAFGADVVQNIDNPFDPTNVNSPLVTSNFTLYRGGTLDNTKGLIDNLSGGSLPAGGLGSAIGINKNERFSLLHFKVVGTRDDSQIVVDLDSKQTGFADGTFVDPDTQLKFTKTLIINDAPTLDPISDVNLPELSTKGKVIVAASDVKVHDDQFGNTPTFTLKTVPTDKTNNPLFAINSTTGEITLTEAGAKTIDFESGITAYTLGITASDGYKTSIEKTFKVNITNVNETTISLDKTAITFSTPLSKYRNGATDSAFVRPNFADTFKYIDITNNAVGDADNLSISQIEIKASGVSIDLPSGDILIKPGKTQRFYLTYAPDAAGEKFSLDDGLIIHSNATNNSALKVALTGKSTYNSDISYDGKVNLGDLAPLNAAFGSRQGDSKYDPTADITGDGAINLAELVPYNKEFGLSVV